MNGMDFRLTFKPTAAGPLAHLGQRWPVALRDRLKQWADARGIGLASAILIIVADRLDADGVR